MCGGVVCTKMVIGLDSVNYDEILELSLLP